MDSRKRKIDNKSGAWNPIDDNKKRHIEIINSWIELNDDSWKSRNNNLQFASKCHKKHNFESKNRNEVVKNADQYEESTFRNEGWSQVDDDTSIHHNEPNNRGCKSRYKDYYKSRGTILGVKGTKQNVSEGRKHEHKIIDSDLHYSRQDILKKNRDLKNKSRSHSYVEKKESDRRQRCTHSHKNRQSARSLTAERKKGCASDLLFLQEKEFTPRENDKPSCSTKCQVKPMSFKRLQYLITKSASEILLTILDKGSGFSTHLDQEINRDKTAYILLAIGKAIDSYLENNITNLILGISANKNFLLVNLQQYLASFQTCTSEQYHLDSLLSLSEFLHRFQDLLPSRAADILIILMPLLKQTCDNLLKDQEELYHSVSEKIQEIEEQNKLVLEKYANKSKERSVKERLQLMNPPENYRSIPVLPNANDILQECAFLRPNIVIGKYQNTEHYLDVQYRLLREDYVKPLRDGISEYLKLTKQGKSVKRCKEVRVYSCVNIVKQEFVRGGLFHVAQFNDCNFSKLKLNFDKHFLIGSLLCLSSDNFTTMLFATVARKDTEELQKGLLLLSFEELPDEILNLNPMKRYVVLETTAYFEAYRHNLNALLELNDENFPMKRYIVEAQTIVHKPLYLRENIAYDLTPLLLPLEQSNVDDIDEYQTDVYEKSKRVNIFNEDCWPTSDELNLDPRQYAALKAALTKEFTVIQGPPGTGKTYLGLRIVQLLIHNIENWQSDENQLPILVICYTNHALDQFLGGLLDFTSKIVRIGSRGHNEDISKFQLNNLKQEIKSKHQVPNYIFSNVKQKNFEMKCLKKNIEETQESIEKCYISILSDEEMNDCMSAQHYLSLKLEGLYLEDDGFLLHDWLGIRNKNKCSDNDFLIIKKNNKKILIERSELSEVANIEYIDKYEEISSDSSSKEFEDDPKSNLHSSNKTLEQYISDNIQQCHAMLEQDAMRIQNIWDLEYRDRWCLYKFWLEFYVLERERKMSELQQDLRREYKELSEMRIEEDIYICKRALVVGMTTTGAAKYRHIVQQLNPKILIVEEAAEILESHVVTSLAHGTQHVILIGDHQQLQPKPTAHSLAVKYNLNVSLFERMIRNGMDCHKLYIQHRMRPEIASLISPHIYDFLKNHDSVTTYENIKGIDKNVFFISHAYNELQERDSKSKVNKHEAKFMISLCKYILLQGYKTSQITVLTTYLGQLFEMKRLCAQGILRGVKFTVVDNYQGEENDIILISFVRSNENGDIGFLKVANRVCVALSRAKKGLYCIGNFELMAGKSDLWKSIVGKLKNDNSIGDSLKLKCQNHPEVINIVATEKDFDSVPEGGCDKKCGFRLKCGHTCTLTCHLYDAEHAEIQCKKSCNKRCRDGHLCEKKCYEECGPCREKVLKTFATCKHTIEVNCYSKNVYTFCAKLCEKYLPCGHMCPKICGKPCTMMCVENVRVTSIVCGHKVTMKCFNYKNVELLTATCEEPCRKELSCGHMCRGTCSSCHQGRLHVTCSQVCKRILICGHECLSPCSKSCPPCDRKCENICFHSKCPRKCGEPCAECAEPCRWRCPHKKCSRLCGEPCDRAACDEPCPKLLKCGHPCIGLCGELCPVECRICYEDKVKEVFFGSEDEVDARFIRLKDCNHIFEVNGITQWMNHDIQENREVQMKVCPKCKVVIRKNLRFGNIVKSCLADIEKVKKITYGNPDTNFQLQQSLLQRVMKSSLSPDMKLRSICKSFIRFLESKEKSIQTITTMENVINILFQLFDVKQSNAVEVKAYDTVVLSSITKLKDYIKLTKKWLSVSIEKAFFTTSEQQLQEMSWEVHRMKLANTLLTYIQNEPNVQSSSSLDKDDALKALLECIVTYIPFGQEEIDKFTTDFSSYVKLIGGEQINVSELEKQSILKAMGLSKGHWYQCPNGHVYCITECGGAMQESKCNECGENIGGTQHALLSTNKVATAMDGAQYSAWSDAMNMENYQI